VTNALGCLAHLGVTAALAYGLDQWMAMDVPAALRPWVALAASALLVLGGANVVQLLRGCGQGDTSRAAILARATTGEPPASGGLMMVTGTARAEGGVPLSSPLSGTPCVAYLYNIYRKRRLKTGHDTTPVWFGAATQPFVVDTGTRAVRVLAMPQIEETRANIGHTADVRDRARDYLSHTAFDDVANVGIAGTVMAMFSDMRDVPVHGLRRDWHREGATDDLSSVHMNESLVPIGETITVIGHWSSERRAIVPEPGGALGASVTVARGDGRKSGTGHALPSSALAVACLGALLIAAGAGLIWAVRAGYLR
jgi:hypothetical protein